MLLNNYAVIVNSKYLNTLGIVQIIYYTDNKFLFCTSKRRWV